VSNFYIFDLENVAKASRRCIGVINKTHRRSARGLHLRRSTASWLNAQVYYTLVDCNPVTPLLRFTGLVAQVVPTLLYAAVGNVLTDTSRRAVRGFASEATATRRFTNFVLYFFVLPAVV